MKKRYGFYFPIIFLDRQFDIKLRQKFILLGLLPVVTTGAICFIGVKQVSRLDVLSENLNRSKMLISEASSCSYKLLHLVTQMVNLRLGGNNESPSSPKTYISEIRGSLASLKLLSEGTPDALNYNVFESRVAELVRVLQEDSGLVTAPSSTSNSSIDVILRTKKLQLLVNRSLESLHQLIAAQKLRSLEIEAEVSEEKKLLFAFVAWAFPAAVLMQLGVAFYFSNNILRDLEKVLENLKRYAANRILLDPIHAKDEIGQLDRRVRTLFESISESRAKERSLILNSPEVVVLTDNYGFIVDIAPCCQRKWGIPAEEIAGRRAIDLVVSEQRELFLNHLKLVANSDESISCNVEIIGLNNKRISTEWTSIAVKHSKLICSVAIDIEAKLALERLKHRVIATVSHELRTPLASISAFHELLEAGNFGTLSQSGRKSVGLINDSTKRLQELISGLLELEKVSLSNMIIEKQQVKIADIFAHVESATAYLASQRGLSLLFAETSEVVSCDGDKIIQVLINFVSNAIKYNSTGSNVRVAVAKCSSEFEFSVADDGPGISKEDSAKVFESFYRSNEAMNSKVSGIGLGLSIAKEIVIAHKGTIGLESVLGEGSRFWFKIPA